MAKKDFIVHIDLNNQQLLNATLQNLAVHPSTANLTQGFVYWNTAAHTAYCYTGLASPNEWLDLGNVYSHPTFAGTSQPSSALTGATVISQITLNNGHVTGVTTRTLSLADIGAAAASHTHAFGEITGLPTNTILGNNTGSTGPAQALTASQLLTMLGIVKGTLAHLTTGTATSDSTWTAADLNAWVNAKLTSYITAVNLALGTRTSTTLPITNSAGTGITLPVSTTTLAGLMSAADKVKLDGIAANANNYVHPTNNPGAHPFATAITSGLQVLSQLVVNNEGHVTSIAGRNLTAADIASVMINDSINNGTNTTWSSTKIYTELQAAINQAQTGALQYKGDYNPNTNSPDITTTSPSGTIKAGYTYVVSVTGTFGGQEVEAGDMIIAKVDNPGGTAGNWQIVNKNIPAIVDATTLVKGIIQLATNAEALTGTDSNKAITPASLKHVLDNQVRGYAANFGNGSNTSFTITHGLNTQDVQVQVLRVSDKKEIEVDWSASAANTVTIDVNVAPANNAYRCIVTRI